MSIKKTKCGYKVVSKKGKNTDTPRYEPQLLIML